MATVMWGGDAAKAMLSSAKAAYTRLWASDGDPRTMTAAMPSPTLAVVAVSDAAAVYVGALQRACDDVGVTLRTVVFPVDTADAVVITAVTHLGTDDGVHGIVVQMPLPESFDTAAVLSAIPASKDVDGLGPMCRGLLPIVPLSCLSPLPPQAEPTPPSLESSARVLVPSTAAAVAALLHTHGVPVAGRLVVVLGRGPCAGGAIASLLQRLDATVVVCHSRTANLPTLLALGDVVVAAVGQPRFVRGEWLKAGAVVVDVGMNRDHDGVLVGDVDFGSVRVCEGTLLVAAPMSSPLASQSVCVCVLCLMLAISPCGCVDVDSVALSRRR